MVAAAIAASAVVGAGASIAASKSASSAAKKSSQVASDTAASDRELQWDMYKQQREDFDKYYGKGRDDLGAGYNLATGTLQPYTQYGGAATGRLAALSGLNGGNEQAFALAQDPGYQFRMNQGVAALDRSAAGRGLLLSGAQTKALNDYGQGMASSELSNAYNRVAGIADAGRGAAGNLATLQSGRGTALANLATGQATQNAGLMTNTTNALTNINQNAAQQQIAAQQAIGQARGSAYTGAANAVNSGVSNGLFYYGLKNGMFGNMSGAGGQQ